MKIIAISDQHGNLNQIKDSRDVLVIAGDLSPLCYQQDYDAVLNRSDNEFIPWMKALYTYHTIIVPCNHDLSCTYSSLSFKDDIDNLIKRHSMSDNTHYLCFESITIDGKKFYGNPNSESPSWRSFSDKHNQIYEFDDDTDILITHQPSRFGDVRFVRRFNKEFGSVDLRNEILRSNISLNICCHIHTGDHETTHIVLNNGNSAIIKNVSILDEDYRVAYEPVIIEI